MLKTKKDQGIIEYPMIAPHLELITFANEYSGIPQAEIDQNPDLLNNFSFSFVVNGKGDGVNLSGMLTRDILLLIDGKRSRYDIVNALVDRYSETSINTVLASLAYKFIIVSIEHQLDKELSALLTHNLITPCYYEQFTQNLNIYCQSLGANDSHMQFLKQGLDALSIPRVDNPQDADLWIVLVDDYLQDDLQQFNKARLADKKQWIPIKLSGVEMMYGPIFIPAKPEAACLHCITNNMRNNREMRGFLEYNKPGSLTSKVELSLPLLSQGHIPYILINLIKSLASKNLDITNLQGQKEDARFKLLDKYVISFDVCFNKLVEHFVNKRPQCLSCGDTELNNIHRAASPVELFKEEAESVFTSGGMKARSPQETFDKYNHLVSYLTGIITSIERSSPEDDAWMHVYWAGSNLAIINRSFMALTNSIRTKSAGKGRSDIQARVSAMCEALERYSGVFNGDEIRKTACFVDFKPGDALHPNDLMLFSQKQYQNRDAISKSGHRFYYLPAEDFDKNTPVEWSPVWSITRQQYVWMMCYQLYFSYDPNDTAVNHNFANPDSNGAASGNTPAEAFVQGFMELVERDAYAIWWYNRLSYPEVDLASFNDPYLDEAVSRYKEKYNRKLWVLDVTNDFGIPVFVAISYRFDKEKQDICVSAGAHFDPHIAALRAVCELNQYISAVLKSTDEPGSYTYFDKECNDWWQNATLVTDPYLLPDENANKIGKSHYPVISRDLNEEVQACIDIVHDLGLEVLVLDQTRPDVGLPVMKVMVPGMRHFWARFAPGRLYDVPVKMGKLDQPIKEQDLNPTPVFI